MTEPNDEKQRQNSFPWQRSKYHTDYNGVLAHFKVVSCLEHARGKSLLDLACGDGLMTSIFAQHFERVVGVDASTQNIEEARRRVPKARFIDSLIEDLDVGEQFSSVFLLDVLEHVVDPIALLKKAATFLEDEGVLIAHVPNCRAVNRQIAVLMGTLTTCDELSPFDIQVAGHRRSYDMSSLKNDAQAAGLDVVSSGGIFYKMLSTPQMDWFLKNGLWEEGSFGWGRVGAERETDWKGAFCRACYEFGKTRPDDCNIVYICCTKS